MGKFATAPLPGLTGPGISSLGGHNFAIATNADNKGSAADVSSTWARKKAMKSNSLATGAAPTLEALYSDPELNKKYPFMEMPEEVDRDRQAAADRRQVR